MVQRRHEGQRLPVPVGAGRPQPLPPGAAPVAAGHVRLGPGLIQEHEAARIKLALRALPPPPALRDIRPILLGGHEAFF